MGSETRASFTLHVIEQMSNPFLPRSTGAQHSRCRRGLRWVIMRLAILNTCNPLLRAQWLPPVIHPWVDRQSCSLHDALRMPDASSSSTPPPELLLHEVLLAFLAAVLSKTLLSPRPSLASLLKNKHMHTVHS